MCLLQYLVTWKDHHIILCAILKSACPIKANISHIVWTITKTYIFLKIFALWMPFHHIIPLHYQTRLSISVNIWWEKWGENWKSAIDFADWLTDLPFIYLAKDNLSLGIHLKLYFCYKRICLTYKLQKQTLRIVFCTGNYFLTLLENFYEIPHYKKYFQWCCRCNFI